MIPLLAIKVDFRCKWCKFHLCLSCGLQVSVIIKDPDVNCLEGDFHSNMCSLLLWHFQFRANQSARRALFISTVTFKNTQLLGKKKKDVCSPESTRESRLGFASFFFSLYPSSSWYYSHVGQALQPSRPSLGQRLTCLNGHLKIYFPECFHTLVWLRWDFN